MRIKNVVRALLAAAMFASLSGLASAQNIIGAPVVATGGNVTATYLGSGGSYVSDLFLQSPGGPVGPIFNTATTPVGSTFDLGPFAAGTELVFRIDVTGDAGGPFSYFTGPAIRNPDNVPHNVVNLTSHLPQTYVAFEDLFGGGDLDYDEVQFSFTGVVPEPSSFILAGIGLVGAVVARRRFRRA